MKYNNGSIRKVIRDSQKIRGHLFGEIERILYYAGRIDFKKIRYKIKTIIYCNWEI